MRINKVWSLGIRFLLDIFLITSIEKLTFQNNEINYNYIYYLKYSKILYSVLILGPWEHSVVLELDEPIAMSTLDSSYNMNSALFSAVFYTHFQQLPHQMVTYFRTFANYFYDDDIFFSWDLTLASPKCPIKSNKRFSTLNKYWNYKKGYNLHLILIWLLFFGSITW